MERSIFGNRHNLRLLAAGIFMAAVFVIKTEGVHAAPQFFVTWRSDSYVPGGYEGKRLPTTGSAVAVSIMGIENNRIVDLSGQMIQWYVNNEFYNSGTGMREITFRVPGKAPGSIEVRYTLPDYPGTPIQSIRIPVVRPQVALQAMHPRLTVPATLSLYAHPFFFNIRSADELTYIWSVNGMPPTGATDPDRLTLTIDPSEAPRSTVRVGITLQNPFRFEEAAQNATTFTVR